MPSAGHDFRQAVAEESPLQIMGAITAYAGLMAKRLGIVPIPGATVDIDNWKLTAESTAGRRHRIDTVVISRDTFIADIEEESND